jgi:hypothetical protein
MKREIRMKRATGWKRGAVLVFCGYCVYTTNVSRQEFRLPGSHMRLTSATVCAAYNFKIGLRWNTTSSDKKEFHSQF